MVRFPYTQRKLIVIPGSYDRYGRNLILPSCWPPPYGLSLSPLLVVCGSYAVIMEKYTCLTAVGVGVGWGVKLSLSGGLRPVIISKAIFRARTSVLIPAVVRSSSCIFMLLWV